MNEEEGTRDPVPADDRCFLYGDGLFETVVALRGRVLWLSLHCERLGDGLRRLEIPADVDELEDALCEQAGALTGQGTEAHALRITVSRGSGERGYAPQGTGSARWRIDGRPLASDPLHAGAPMKVRLSDITLAEQPLLAGIKHCNRLEQIIAAQEALRTNVDDVLMRNARGLLQCSSRANLFLLVDGTLCTPDCEREGIAGTRRRLILEHLAPSLGIPTALRSVAPADLPGIQGAFLCNSIMGIRAIGEYDGDALSIPDEIAALQRLYREQALACAPLP